MAELNTEEKNLQQTYLKDKINDLTEKLGDGYGEPLLNELIRRLEKTISDFNAEVTDMISELKNNSEKRRNRLQNLIEEEQQPVTEINDKTSAEPEIQTEMSSWEKKLESKSSEEPVSKEKVLKKEEKPGKKKKFFSRKKK